MLVVTVTSKLAAPRLGKILVSNFDLDFERTKK